MTQADPATAAHDTLAQPGHGHRLYTWSRDTSMWRQAGGASRGLARALQNPAWCMTPGMLEKQAKGLTGRALEASVREEFHLRPWDCQLSAAMIAMGSVLGTGRTSVPAAPHQCYNGEAAIVMQ